MNIPPALAYDMAQQRQRDLIVSAERYRASHPQRPQRQPGDVSIDRHRLPRWLAPVLTRGRTRHGLAPETGRENTATWANLRLERDKKTMPS